MSFKTKNRIALAAGVIALLSFAPAQASSRMAQVRPSWATQSASELGANSSFLNGRVSDNASSTKDELIAPAMASQMKLQYEDMNRSYDQRATYAQVSPEEARQHSQAMRDFSKSMALTVGRYQLSQNLEKVRQFAENDPILGTLKNPAALIAAGVAIYGGQPVRVRIGDDVHMTAKAHGPSREGQFAVQSSVVNTTVDVKAGSRSDEEERQQKALDPTRRDERFRLGFSRGLPVWDLQSGVSYGGTTGTMTASVSKQLNRNLTCVVDSSHNLTTAQSSEESLKLLYGLRF